MNYQALSEGVNALAEIINNGELLKSEVKIDDSLSNYYGWGGVVDYINFRKCSAARAL